MAKLLALLAPWWFAGVAYAAQAQDLLLVGGGTSSAHADTNVTVKDDFLKTIQVYLVSAYGLIAIGVFVFIGARLFAARGNESEFKHAWLALTYACIGLAIAPLAFVVVQIILGFSISS